jgi:hypothetical protein
LIWVRGRMSAEDTRSKSAKAGSEIDDKHIHEGRNLANRRTTAEHLRIEGGHIDGAGVRK